MTDHVAILPYRGDPTSCLTSYTTRRISFAPSTVQLQE